MGVLARAVCVLINHKWVRHRYPALGSEDQPEGTYLLCLRCGRRHESVGKLPGSWMPF